MLLDQHGFLPRHFFSMGFLQRKSQVHSLIKSLCDAPCAAFRLVQLVTRSMVHQDFVEFTKLEDYLNLGAVARYSVVFLISAIITTRSFHFQACQNTQKRCLSPSTVAWRHDPCTDLVDA